MSKEKIKVRQWPYDRTWEAINGSGFDTHTINYLNNYGTEEEKRAFIRGRRKEAAEATLALAGIIGVPWGIGTAINGGHPFETPNRPALEQHGDHHGLSGMPSEQHLQQFTHEHGIHIKK